MTASSFHLRIQGALPTKNQILLLVWLLLEEQVALHLLWKGSSPPVWMICDAVPLTTMDCNAPFDVTEIHVFPAILQPFLTNNACARSVTRTSPNCDPFQTLEQIIDQWWDLELEEHDQSWMLSPVNSAYTWSSVPAASSPTYVLARKGNSFHLLRSHGVLEVIWGHRQWTTAIALPKWINNYHCLGLLAQTCGPILTSSCAMWCENARLSEKLIECHIGSFLQVHIKTLCSDLVRIDLQAALQRSIQILHLPVHQLSDELVKMKVFVRQEVTCFSSATFDCTSSFENWWKVLMDEGRRVYSRKNFDTMIFHRHIRTVVFALFAARFEFLGASHWTPSTQMWDTLDLCGGDRRWITTISGSHIRSGSTPR